MYSDPFLLGTVKSAPERERRLISHRLARSLGVWGGGRGEGGGGRGVGREKRLMIYTETLPPLLLYIYNTSYSSLSLLLLLIAHHHAVTAPTARAQSVVGSLPVSEG